MIEKKHTHDIVSLFNKNENKGDHPFKTSANFHTFWPLPPYRRQIFSTIRRQIWQIFSFLFFCKNFLFCKLKSRSEKRSTKVLALDRFSFMLAFATKDPITKIASHKYFILYQPPLKIIEDFINSSLVTLVPRIHRVKDSFILRKPNKHSFSKIPNIMAI